MEYTKSDGLILVSLYGADKGSGATLPGTIAYAKMLTDSLPPAAELSQGLTRFLRAGILSVTSDRYVLSEDIRGELKTAIGKQGKWAELPDKAFNVLKERRDASISTKSVTLTPNQVAEALQEFRKGNG